MYNPGVGESRQNFVGALLTRTLPDLRDHVTTANLVGLVGSVFVLFCLLALPLEASSRLLLYFTVTVWTILRPRVALYLLPIAIPWGSLDALDLGGISLTSADILVFLLAASWLMSFVLRPLAAVHLTSGPLDREGFNVPPFLTFAMLALLFAMFLSMTVASSLSLSLKEISKWVELFLVVVLGAQYLRARRQIWTLVVIICLAAISQAFFGYFQAYFNLGPIAFIRPDAGLGLRIYGTFGQPNPYAGYINMTLTIAIALTLLARTLFLRILAGITATLLAVALYLSQSRGAEIAIAAALLFIFTAGMPRIRPLIAGGAITTLGIVGAYFAGLVPVRFLLPVLKQLGLAGISLTAPTNSDYSTAERIAHWIAGINMFLDHPFLGVGIGNYPTAYPQYFITVFADPLGHAHNYYINIAAEAGLFGLTGLVLFLVATFMAGGRSLRTLSRMLKKVQQQRITPHGGISTTENRKSLALSYVLTDDRALAVGLLASLLSVCMHNLVDNLYVHSMTSLFALLLIMLIRLAKVTPNVESNGGDFAY